MLRMIVDQVSLRTLKRAGLRLLIIIIFASTQLKAPWGFMKGLQLLLQVNALICTAIAAYKRESAVSRNLGHWDEAAFLLMLCLGVHFIIRIK